MQVRSGVLSLTPTGGAGVSQPALVPEPWGAASQARHAVLFTAAWCLGATSLLGTGVDFGLPGPP
eukprot:4865858-Pyramimonas_sp.AAC.1